MSFLIFGGYFMYTEHAPAWLQFAFGVACAYEMWRDRRRA